MEINEWTRGDGIPEIIYNRLIDIVDKNNLKHSPNYRYVWTGNKSFNGMLFNLPIGSFYELCKKFNLI